MKDIEFTVKEIKKIAPKIFSLTLFSEEKLPPMHCGQFLHMEVKDDALPLRRPFCLYKFDERSVTLIIAVVGKGTEKICSMQAGEKVRAIVPIGNGFTPAPEHKKIALIGGGVGCAPLFTLKQCYPDREYRAYLGFSSKENVVLYDDFKKEYDVVLSTDDGSAGEKGYVTDAFKRRLSEFMPDIILTCGPVNMLKSVARVSKEISVPAYMSGENRMACGVGACLVCTCAVKQKDGSVRNMRSCVDGPVFDLNDLEL